MHGVLRRGWRRWMSSSISERRMTTSMVPDVAVVGVGVVGLSIARELAAKGNKVTLIGSLITGKASASMAAGAMIDAIGEIENESDHLGSEQLDLRLAAQRTYRGWLNELQAESGISVFHREGMYIIGNSGGDHDVTKLAHMQAAMDKHNEPYELVLPRDVQGLNPNVQYQAHSALWLPGALSVDSQSLLHALGTCVSHSPKVTWRKTDCRRIVRASGRLWQVELADGTVLAFPAVVLCAGAFSQDLVGRAVWSEAKLPELYFGRGSSVIVSGMPALPHAIRTPNRALACGLHVVPRDNGEWYVGSTNLFGTRVPTAHGATCGELHTLLGQTSNELNTSLRNATVQRVCWGLRPVTATGAPIFGATVIEGLHVATGTHRQGVTIAPEVARLVSTELLRGEELAHPFSPKLSKAPQDLDIGLGVRSLLATTLYPTGSMPYNRQHEMEVFLEALLRISLNDKHADKELQTALKTISRTVDMSEQCVIRLYHEVLEKHLPKGGPYVT